MELSFNAFARDMWPSGNVHGLQHAENVWNDISQTLHDSAQNGDRAAIRLDAHLSGLLGRQFRAARKAIWGSDNPESAIQKLKAAAERAAKDSGASALHIDTARTQIKYTIIALAIQLIFLVRKAWFFKSASTEAQLGARGAILRILRTLNASMKACMASMNMATSIAVSVLTSVGVEAATQGEQLIEGIRKAADPATLVKAFQRGIVDGVAEGIFEIASFLRKSGVTAAGGALLDSTGSPLSLERLKSILKGGLAESGEEIGGSVVGSTAAIVLGLEDGSFDSFLQDALVGGALGFAMGGVVHGVAEFSPHNPANLSAAAAGIPDVGRFSAAGTQESGSLPASAGQAELPAESSTEQWERGSERRSGFGPLGTPSVVGDDGSQFIPEHASPDQEEIRGIHQASEPSSDYLEEEFPAVSAFAARAAEQAPLSAGGNCTQYALTTDRLLDGNIEDGQNMAAPRSSAPQAVPVAEYADSKPVAVFDALNARDGEARQTTPAAAYNAIHDAIKNAPPGSASGLVYAKWREEVPSGEIVHKAHAYIASRDSNGQVAFVSAQPTADGRPGGLVALRTQGLSRLSLVMKGEGVGSSAPSGLSRVSADSLSQDVRAGSDSGDEEFFDKYAAITDENGRVINQVARNVAIRLYTWAAPVFGYADQGKLHGCLVHLVENDPDAIFRIADRADSQESPDPSETILEAASAEFDASVRESRFPVGRSQSHDARLIPTLEMWDYPRHLLAWTCSPFFREKGEESGNFFERIERMVEYERTLQIRNGVLSVYREAQAIWYGDYFAEPLDPENILPEDRAAYFKRRVEEVYVRYLKEDPDFAQDEILGDWQGKPRSPYSDRNAHRFFLALYGARRDPNYPDQLPVGQSPLDGLDGTKEGRELKAMLLDPDHVGQCVDRGLIFPIRGKFDALVSRLFAQWQKDLGAEEPVDYEEMQRQWREAPESFTNFFGGDRFVVKALRICSPQKLAFDLSNRVMDGEVLEFDAAAYRSYLAEDLQEARLAKLKNAVELHSVAKPALQDLLNRVLDTRASDSIGFHQFLLETETLLSRVHHVLPKSKDARAIEAQLRRQLGSTERWQVRLTVGGPSTAEKMKRFVGMQSFQPAARARAIERVFQQDTPAEVKTWITDLLRYPAQLELVYQQYRRAQSYFDEFPKRLIPVIRERVWVSKLEEKPWLDGKTQPTGGWVEHLRNLEKGAGLSAGTMDADEAQVLIKHVFPQLAEYHQEVAKAGPGRNTSNCSVHVVNSDRAIDGYSLTAPGDLAQPQHVDYSRLRHNIKNPVSYVLLDTESEAPIWGVMPGNAYSAVAQAVAVKPHGTRAVLYVKTGEGDQAKAHVINVVNYHGIALFLDAQAGGLARLSVSDVKMISLTPYLIGEEAEIADFHWSFDGEFVVVPDSRPDSLPPGENLTAAEPLDEHHARLVAACEPILRDKPAEEVANFQARVRRMLENDHQLGGKKIRELSREMQGMWFPREEDPVIQRERERLRADFIRKQIDFTYANALENDHEFARQEVERLLEASDSDSRVAREWEVNLGQRNIHGTDFASQEGNVFAELKRISAGELLAAWMLNPYMAGRVFDDPELFTWLAMESDKRISDSATYGGKDQPRGRWSFLARPSDHCSEPVIHRQSASPEIMSDYVSDRFSWLPDVNPQYPGDGVVEVDSFDEMQKARRYSENCLLCSVTVSRRLDGKNASAAGVYGEDVVLSEWSSELERATTVRPQSYGASSSLNYHDKSTHCDERPMKLAFVKNLTWWPKLGRVFKRKALSSVYSSIISAVKADGAGGRGILIPYEYGISGNLVAHVTNVVNTSDGPVILDGQNGKVGCLPVKVNSVISMAYSPDSNISDKMPFKFEAL